MRQTWSTGKKLFHIVYFSLELFCYCQVIVNIYSPTPSVYLSKTVFVPYGCARVCACELVTAAYS